MDILGWQTFLTMLGHDYDYNYKVKKMEMDEKGVIVTFQKGSVSEEEIIMTFTLSPYAKQPTLLRID